VTIVESDTDDATVDETVPCQNEVRVSFHPDTEKSVKDVLVPQQLQDYITTVQPTTQAVRAQKTHKENKARARVSSGRLRGLG
jgi:hypothetical protein